MGIKDWLDKLTRALNQVDMDKLREAALRDLGEKVVAHARRYTPVDTGKLRQGWTYRVEGGKLIISNPVEYAAAVNNGHRILDAEGRTVGYAPGVHMLEKAMAEAAKGDLSATQRSILAGMRKELGW